MTDCVIFWGYFQQFWARLKYFYQLSMAKKHWMKKKDPESKWIWICSSYIQADNNNNFRPYPLLYSKILPYISNYVVGRLFPSNSLISAHSFDLLTLFSFGFMTTFPISILVSQYLNISQSDRYRIYRTLKKLISFSFSEVEINGFLGFYVSFFCIVSFFFVGFHVLFSVSQ